MATPMTPTEDRECIKRMGHSLIAFSRLRSLTKMSKQQLADMPKEVMISCAPNEIAIVWDKLPEHLQNDIDMLKYQYCTEHYSSEGDAAAAAAALNDTDVNDGPAPRRIYCCYCRVRDITVASNNDLKISIKDETATSNQKEVCRYCCCDLQ